ncbi:MAG TPA: hypothetical protein VN688_29860 [Gemmataceae bacterium]|nr:hypothetical protein [Gemmataceae bacterium]
MLENNIDTPEFTDEQLRAALKRMGQDARQTAFAADLPIIVVKDGSIVALHADGSEEFVEPLRQEAHATRERE